MPLRAEIARLLATPPYGGLAALARELGLEHASVSAWKRAVAAPGPDKWSRIEAYLGLPDGHLARAEAGLVDQSVRPNWPTVAAKPTEPGLGQRTVVYVDESVVTTLLDRVGRLERAVQYLLREADATKDVDELLDAIRAAPAVERGAR